MLETKDKRRYDTKVDVWALGVLLFELLTTNVPFSGHDQTETIRNIKRMHIPWPNNFPIKAKDLISKLLKAKPEHRIVLDELHKHPWIESHEPLRDLIENEEIIND